MGATGIYFNGTAAEAREFMLHLLQADILTSNEKLVNHSFARDAIDNTTEIYCAVQNINSNIISGMVVLYKLYKSDREICYRYYDEVSFPYHCNCPKKILELLSPVESIVEVFNLSEQSRENATQWRKMCLLNLAKQSRKKAQQKEIKKLISVERQKPFLIRTEGADYHFYSLAKFKVQGKFLKTGSVTFHCESKNAAKFFLEEFQKAFANGAAGYNATTQKVIKRA